MKGQKISVHIPCPIHASEMIQRVAVDLDASQQLFCPECILTQEISISLNLKTIPDVLETAADYYAQNLLENAIHNYAQGKSYVRIGEKVPSQYLSLLEGQAAKLEGLRNHLEDEKKKVSNVFDMIMQDMVKIITEKKNKCLYELDQQLFNLRYWYIFFDRQIKKVYPTIEVYPSKEHLATQLGQIENASELMAFVRNLNEDLNEENLAIRSSMSLEGGKKTDLNNISEELIKVVNMKPRIVQREVEVVSLQNEIQARFKDLLGRLFDFENQIGDVVKGSNFDSKYLKTEDFNLLKQWIPQGWKLQPKLVYRGSRDGMDSVAFHSKCDGLTNTISIIKCQFLGNSKSSLIGGYLDKAWDSSGSYIPSFRSFIFSLHKDEVSYQHKFIRSLWPSWIWTNFRRR